MTKIKDLPKFERPREDNPDYGYLEIKGKRYYQLYTTTEVKDDNVPPGSHYHRIDLRGEK